jgi:hypothetical protein
MMLCMDQAGDHFLVVGLVKEKKNLKVCASLTVPLSDLPRFFGEEIKNLAGGVDEIRVSGPLENTFHKIFIVPDLKKKMLSAAVETEVLKAFGADYQFKEKDLGQVPGPGTKVNRKMMAAGIKRAGLEELYGMFADSRTKPSLYTTYPTALHGLLDKLQVLSDKPLAFIQVEKPLCRIVVFKGEEIRLTRELPVSDGAEDAETSGLGKDIYRTLLFYNDTYPEERAERLMFAGSCVTPEMVESLKQKTGAEIVPFDPAAVFETDRQTACVHPGCLGLALLEPDRLDFGFVPFSVQEKRRIKRTLVLCSSAAAGVFLVFILILSRLSFDLKDLDAFHGGIKGEIRMKEDRLREMPLEFVSQSIETSQPPWSEILMELAAAVPPGVALSTFTLKDVKRVWRGEVTGVADGSDEINSLLKVEETEDNFTKSPLFDGVKLTERELQGERVEFKIIYQLSI